MNKEFAFGAIIGALVIFVLSYTNLPGKYQIVAVTDPKTHNMQSCLLDTRTGRIQILYNFDNILMFGKPEATMKQWEGWQESEARYESSKTTPPTK